MSALYSFQFLLIETGGGQTLAINSLLIGFLTNITGSGILTLARPFNSLPGPLNPKPFEPQTLCQSYNPGRLKSLFCAYNAIEFALKSACKRI